MKTKVLILLMILVGLGTGGYFVWKNISAPEKEMAAVSIVLTDSPIFVETEL